MGAMPIRADELSGAGAFEMNEEEFEDLGVVEGDEDNHDEGHRSF